MVNLNKNIFELDGSVKMVGVGANAQALHMAKYICQKLLAYVPGVVAAEKLANYVLAQKIQDTALSNGHGPTDLSEADVVRIGKYVIDESSPLIAGQILQTLAE